jgi:hypothetical protein
LTAASSGGLNGTGVIGLATRTGCDFRAEKERVTTLAINSEATPHIS